MRYRSQGVAEAAQEAVSDISELGGVAGRIASDWHGTLAMPYRAVGMYRGSVDEHGIMEVALYDD
jgi:beta-aspartyl-peptidase (threonine type)